MFHKRSGDRASGIGWGRGRTLQLMLSIGLLMVVGVLAWVPFQGRGTPPPVRAEVSNGTTLTLSPSAGAISACDTIQVEIWVNDVTDLYGGDFQLTFDPTKLEVVDADLGTPEIEIEPLSGFLKTDWVLRKSADNTAGTIWYAVTQLNPTEAVSGSGAVARFQLRGRGGGAPVLAWHDTLIATKLTDRDGDEIPATPVDETINTVPPPAPVLSIAKPNSTTARLSWTGVAGIAGYHLYRDTAPYFTPGGTPFHSTTSLSYDDAGAVGSPATNYYYVVRSSCDNGFESGNSGRVGEFDFAMVPGVPPAAFKWNYVALGLDPAPTIHDAISLASEIGGAVKVMRWDCPSQDFRYPWDIYLTSGAGDNFATETGRVYLAELDDTATSPFSFVGRVPDEGEVCFDLCKATGAADFRWNFISLPLDQGHLTTASELAADIGGVVMVMEWDASSQDFVFPDNIFLPGSGGGTGEDFPIRIGYPYLVRLDSTAPSTWPCD